MILFAERKIARACHFQSGGILFQDIPRHQCIRQRVGCRYDNEYNVPLSQKDRNLVEAIQREERYRRCP
jgi:hypothetical protein